MPQPHDWQAPHSWGKPGRFEQRTPISLDTVTTGRLVDTSGALAAA
ncbi:hypothetical protein [Streptomyces sp. NPDC001876]